MRGRRLRTQAHIAAIALAVLLTACSSPAAVITEPEFEPTPVPSPPPPSPFELAIPASTATIDLIPVMESVLTRWQTEGCGKPYTDYYLDEYEGDTEAFAPGLAEQMAPIFAEALFGPDWAIPTGSKDTAPMIENLQGRHATFVRWCEATARDDLQFEFAEHMVSQTVLSDTGGQVEIEAVIEETNNAAEARVPGPDSDQVDQDGLQYRIRVSFVRTAAAAYVDLYTFLEPVNY